MLTLLAAAALVLFQAEDPGKGRLPLQTPESWIGKRQEGAFVLVPKDLPQGKLYTVVSADLQTKVGSLDGLLDAGKASLGQSGTFKALKGPAESKSEGGWDYKVLIGALEKEGAALPVQVIAFRKGEDEGLVMVVSDSVETLEKYSDAFSAMIRSVGAPKTAAPAAPAATANDVRYKAPEGWTSKTLDGGIVMFTLDKKDFYEQYSYRILILPSEPLQGTLRQKFQNLWTVHVNGNFTTTIVPIPLVRRLKSGMAVAVDQDGRAKNKDGVVQHAGLTLLARGNRCVPILGFYFGLGNTDLLQKALEPMLESAEIPGSGDDRVALVDAADLPGSWSTSSVSLANYVTSAGAYAGDASIATGEGVTLNKDGTFKRSFRAVSAKMRFQENSEGTWKTDDNLLDLTLKDGSKQVYRIFGVGGDAKGGTFLILSNAANTEQQADLCIPRRTFVGEWFKRKD
ncbi:MAG TPA: hypothetical protein VE981_01650 [Planctomycetota bacterium]|nr:hypothetical protein [Planctomycetota bacterium]